MKVELLIDGSDDKPRFNAQDLGLGDIGVVAGGQYPTRGTHLLRTYMKIVGLENPNDSWDVLSCTVSLDRIYRRGCGAQLKLTL